MNILKTIGNFLKKVFSKKTLDLVSVAYPIVKDIAIITGNRTANEVLTAAAKYGVDVVFDESLSYHDRGFALADIAVKFIAAAYPSIPVEKIAAAVQVAYNGYKATRGA